MVDKALEPGALIAGRYRLERPLGEGGMATVWEATHVVTRRVVAMKFLRDALCHKPELRLRFLIEASAASALQHPNVVEILDVFDADDQRPVMVMELLRGQTLGQKLERDERLGLEETATLLLPVLSAVGTAHAHGVVHRDLKPENVFLASTDAGVVVKVLDFGIAKLTAGHHAEHGAPVLRTVTGSFLGTPCYMAPEQATGDAPIDHRADIWSIGVMLYECLSGTRPIEGDNVAQVVARLMTAGIIPLERLVPELPDEVTATVGKMLNRDTSLRVQDLRDAFALLARHTRVSAPSFGPPATGEAAAPSPPSAAPASATLLSKGREPPADPRAPTLLSQPISSSVTVNAGPSARPARRAAAFALLFLGLIGGASAGTVWLLRGAAPPASSASPSAAVAGSHSPLPEPEPTPVVSSTPAPPASSTGKLATRSPSKPATRSGAARVKPSRPAPATRPKPLDSELAFPGGRK